MAESDIEKVINEERPVVDVPVDQYGDVRWI